MYQLPRRPGWSEGSLPFQLFSLNALIIARIPALITSGRAGQASTTAARSGPVGAAGRAEFGAARQPAYVFVNNRLEGNAPSTIEAVVNSIVI
jgi:hypothetical protein